MTQPILHPRKSGTPTQFLLGKWVLPQEISGILHVQYTGMVATLRMLVWAKRFDRGTCSIFSFSRHNEAFHKVLLHCRLLVGNLDRNHSKLKVLIVVDTISFILSRSTGTLQVLSLFARSRIRAGMPIFRGEVKGVTGSKGLPITDTSVLWTRSRKNSIVVLDMDFQLLQLLDVFNNNYICTHIHSPEVVKQMKTTLPINTL